MTKYYENLRLVYEMESRVRELRRTTEAEPAPHTSGNPQTAGARRQRQSQLDRPPGATGSPGVQRQSHSLQYKSDVAGRNGAGRFHPYGEKQESSRKKFFRALPSTN